ncbi:MAG: putative transposase [Candidatus Pseudothioglobus sp.]|jgi:putative transposase
MAAYTNWLCGYANNFNIEVHGWVLMTNHVHLLRTPMGDLGLLKVCQS